MFLEPPRVIDNTEDGENIFSKAVVMVSVNNDANQTCQRTKKMSVTDLLPNGLHEKVIICY